jgi:hypothetical protein
LALAFSAAGLTGAWFTYQGLEKPVTIGRPAATAQAAKPGAAPLPAAGQFKMPPMKTFQAILDRPVFSPSRRPKAGAAVVVSQDLAVRLAGVSGTAKTPLAILVPNDGGDTVILRQGQQYRGWTLSEIDFSSKTVLFRRGDDEVKVEMKFEAAPRQVRQRPARPDARQPPGAQRNVRQDRQKQQQNLQQRKQQDRRLQRNRQQQNQQRQNQQRQNQQRQNQQQQNQQQQNQQQQNQQQQQQQNTQQNQLLN